MAEVSAEFQKVFEHALTTAIQTHSEAINRQRGLLDTVMMTTVNKLVNIDPEQSVALAKTLRGDPVAERQQAMKGAQSTPPETAEPA